MTVAICFKCGATKFGAFTPCEQCHVKPESDDDLIISLAMTDHYVDADALKGIGANIKQGLNPTLSPERHQAFAEELQKMKKDPIFCKMMGLTPESGS